MAEDEDDDELPSVDTVPSCVKMLFGFDQKQPGLGQNRLAFDLGQN